MFESLLIANRAEIACRVMRTCRRMGIKTIAVYSDADANARHVREADVAVRIGPAPARDSYLNAQAILDAALATGAQAIHPGYGFLSEKLELIDACAAAGIVFVGPHRDAIARMGSKIESKRIAHEAGVTCVPGYDGADQGEARLMAEGTKIGFPLLIKASAGGGGKGMKRVDAPDQLASQLHAARQEALAAFGDNKVLLERFITRPRHLEVQLLGDKHGNLVHLFERECSIQRNYQKVIEEAPANHLDDEVREALFASALALGRTIGYDSAGTVEFVLDADQDDKPYFLEMNTRLQVEHPVTELTTGLDLVECQIRSAMGEPLAFMQADIRRHGWAIEARINAEVPEEQFSASFGPVLHYSEPQAQGLRIDSGIDAQSEVTPHYDSMLAKVIAFGGTRGVARERLRQGIAELRIDGVQTNQGLLAAVLSHDAFAGVLTTRFLPDVFPDGFRPMPQLATERAGAAAAAWYFSRVHEAAQSDQPLATLTGFRLTTRAGRRARYAVRVGDGSDLQKVAIECLSSASIECAMGDARHVFVRSVEAILSSGGHSYHASGDASDNGNGSALGLWCNGDYRLWTVLPEVAVSTSALAGPGSGDAVVTDLPGVLTQILVEPGQAVTAGMPVAVVEAMKLFHTLIAPRAGIVASTPIACGVTVHKGAVLASLEPIEGLK